MKRLFKIFMVAVLAMTLIIPLGLSSVEVQAASKIKLSSTKKTITEGKSFTLKVKGTKKKAKWSTSDKKVATVNANGKVTGKGKGSCKITAKVAGTTLSCTVVVEKIELSSTMETINKGDTVTLKVSGTKDKVKWSTSNKTIATVNANGKVTGKGEGSCTITAQVAGKKLTCKITVNKVDETFNGLRIYGLNEMAYIGWAEDEEYEGEWVPVGMGICIEADSTEKVREDGMYEKTVTYFLINDGYTIPNTDKLLVFPFDYKTGKYLLHDGSEHTMTKSEVTRTAEGNYQVSYTLVSPKKIDTVFIAVKDTTGHHLEDYKDYYPTYDTSIIDTSKPFTTDMYPDTFGLKETINSGYYSNSWCFCIKN